MLTTNFLLAFIVSLHAKEILSFTIPSMNNGKLASISSSTLHFNIPTFGANENKDDKPEKPEGEEKKIGLSGLVQLITAGMGSPFLGDYEGVDEETGNFMFSLEANNLVDEVR